MRALVLGLLVAACGCRDRTPSSVERLPCSGPARLELRRADGGLDLRIVDAPRGGGLDLCDAGGQRTASLAWGGTALRLVDQGGQEQLLAADAAALEVMGPSGQVLRLFRADPVLRVLRPDGIPHGSLAQGADGAIVVADAGGAPMAKVVARDADAVVVGPDGSTRAYLVPSPGLIAAGAFALVGLPLEQRAFLAVHLARPHFSTK